MVLPFSKIYTKRVTTVASCRLVISISGTHLTVLLVQSWNCCRGSPSPQGQRRVQVKARSPLHGNPVCLGKADLTLPGSFVITGPCRGREGTRNGVVWGRPGDADI